MKEQRLGVNLSLLFEASDEICLQLSSTLWDNADGWPNFIDRSWEVQLLIIDGTAIKLYFSFFWYLYFESLFF